MSYYLHTPTDEEVRGAITRFDLAWTDGGAAFDRWLAARDAAALSAAAPAIQAAALRGFASEVDDRAEASHKVSQNRAAHDFPTRVRYAAYADEARCIAHVLRARADQLEGETK